jgi:GT2 family glycosyltransferase/glycosyltransferase involved in cell wall biosynthesis
MRVLHLVHGFPPSASAGTEVYTRELARAQAAGGDEVHVLTREAMSGEPELRVRTWQDGALTVHAINNTFEGIADFDESHRHPRLRVVAEQLIEGLHPDVAHVHHLTCLSTDLVRSLRARGVPVVLMLNDYWLLCHRGQRIDLDGNVCSGPAPEKCARCIAPMVPATARPGGEVLRRLDHHLPPASAMVRGAALAVLRHAPASAATTELAARRIAAGREVLESADRILAPSEAVARFFLENGAPPGKLERITQGIDRSRFARLERTAASRLRIGFVGTLMYSKAPHLLLEAFSRLPPGRAELTLIGPISGYHGDERYPQQLRPLLAQPGVTHLGARSNDEVAQRLAGLDVLVMPSIWPENSPVIIREALLAGLPVIGSRVGGIPELIEHERNGLLFAPGDAEGLRRALLRLLEEPELLPRLREGIRPPPPIEDDAAHTARLYGELLRARATAPRRPRIASVVLNFRTAAHTLACVASLRASERVPDAIVVVDNGSHDGSAEFLRARASPSSFELLCTERNLGYSGGMNVGLRRALELGADAVFLLNGDASVTPHCLGLLERALDDDPALGIVAPALVNADGVTVESLGIDWSPRTGRLWNRGFGEQLDALPRPGLARCSGVSGAAMLVRARVLREAGLFDEAFFYGVEDLDLCLRAARAGFATACRADAIALHAGALSIGPRSARRQYFSARNQLLLAARADAGSSLSRAARVASVAALNTAHALLRSPAPRLSALASLALGFYDAAVGRFGSDD